MNPELIEALAALKTLEKSATPWPWHLYVPEWNDITFGVHAAPGALPIVRSEARETPHGIQNDADARLIVALRNVVPEILAANERQWKPFETAPKRCRFLAYYEPGKMCFCVEPVQTIEGEKGWVIADINNGERIVLVSGLTHWMELPLPPGKGE